VWRKEDLSGYFSFTKAKQSRYTSWRRLGERRYSSYSLLTSALDGVSGQRHAPAALCSGEMTPGNHFNFSVYTARKMAAFAVAQTYVLVAQSVQCQATDWTNGRWRFASRQRREGLVSVSRPALGPTQPSVQWVPVVLSPGLKRGRGVTLTTHPIYCQD
jgi:hypothetical protein